VSEPFKRTFEMKLDSIRREYNAFQGATVHLVDFNAKLSITFLGIDFDDVFTGEKVPAKLDEMGNVMEFPRLKKKRFKVTVEEIPGDES
jgi:hypothetical protein